jgi:hypothetical protein
MNTEHTIHLARNDNSVTVGIQTNLPQGYTDGTSKPDRTVEFTHECNSDVEAELLLRYLKKRHTDTIRSIRRKEFFAGWKHALAKKHGRKWFSWFSDTLSNQAS